jgi:predicted nucleic acid-binding protein
VSAICIIDTSVFCNILDVPRRNQHHAQSLAELEAMVAAGHTLLLPLAAIYETGNHIAHSGDGTLRRRTARVFVTQVRAAFSGEAPWTPTLVPEPEEFIVWLDEFPDHAGRGTGMADLSIIKAWEQQCALHQARRVFIWSYDGDLQSYDRLPRI